jgi:hypothetical protein
MFQNEKPGEGHQIEIQIDEATAQYKSLGGGLDGNHRRGQNRNYLELRM